MRKLLLATTLVATFSAQATTVTEDAWYTKVQDESRITYNQSSIDESLFSFNCKDGSYAWVSINVGDKFYVWPQNDPELQITAISIIDKQGEVTQFKQNDLDFWELAMATGQRRLQHFTDALASALVVRVSTSDNHAYIYHGALPFKGYNDVSKECKIKNK